MWVVMNMKTLNLQAILVVLTPEIEPLQQGSPSDWTRRPKWATTTGMGVNDTGSKLGTDSGIGWYR